MVVELGQALAGLERLLAGTTPTGHPNQLAQWHHLGCIAAVERQFAGASVASTNYGLVLPAGQFLLPGRGGRCRSAPPIDESPPSESRTVVVVSH